MLFYLLVLRKIASARSASCRASSRDRGAASHTCCHRHSGDSARRKACRARSSWSEPRVAASGVELSKGARHILPIASGWVLPALVRRLAPTKASLQCCDEDLKPGLVHWSPVEKDLGEA